MKIEHQIDLLVARVYTACNAAEKATPEVLEIWRQAIKAANISIAQIKGGEAQFVIYAPWRPRLAPGVDDFIRFIQGSLEEQALNAWNYMITEVKKTGSGNSVCFENKALANTVRSVFGNFERCLYAINDQDVERLQRVKSRFLKEYQSFLKTTDWNDLTAGYLEGYHERVNAESIRDGRITSMKLSVRWIGTFERVQKIAILESMNKSRRMLADASKKRLAGLIAEKKNDEIGITPARDLQGLLRIVSGSRTI